MLPQQQQQQQTLKRQLRFSWIKPVFGDYHQFSTDPVHDSSQEPPGIVVKTPSTPHPSQPTGQPSQSTGQSSRSTAQQPSTQHSTSLCLETSKVTGNKRRQPTSATNSIGTKNSTTVGFGVCTNTQSGRQPGRVSERVVSSGSLKDASQTNVDLGFKPPGLKMERKECYDWRPTSTNVAAKKIANQIQLGSIRL